MFIHITKLIHTAANVIMKLFFSKITLHTYALTKLLLY